MNGWKSGQPCATPSFESPRAADAHQRHAKQPAKQRATSKRPTTVCGFASGAQRCEQNGRQRPASRQQRRTRARPFLFLARSKGATGAGDIGLVAGATGASDAGLVADKTCETTLEFGQVAGQLGDGGRFSVDTCLACFNSALVSRDGRKDTQSTMGTAPCHANLAAVALNSKPRALKGGRPHTDAVSCALARRIRLTCTRGVCSAPACSCPRAAAVAP